MDEVPAGPASPEPGGPSLSVVIPVFNGGRDFECCLLRLRDSSTTDFETIVIDDGSTDSSGALAESLGARVVRHDKPLGPAAARNLGAKLAFAPLVFFLDADVAVHPDTISRALARFQADPGLTALFGSYDDKPTVHGLVSQYRNLLHHFVHQQGDFVDDARPAKTFWTGCGVIRKADFLDHGGFDPGLYRRPAIEDIELGYRLTRSGCRIILARDIQASHMKCWTLAKVIKTDIFQRGVPWMLLMKRSQIQESDLNVQPGQKLCVVAAGLLTMILPATYFRPWLLAAVPLALATIVALNRDFYRFLARKRGWAFAIAAIPLHYIYYCCCGLSVIIAMVFWHFPVLSAESRGIEPADDLRRDRANAEPIPPPARGAATESFAMDQAVTVALVRGPQRREAAAVALALIADELRASVPSQVVLVPRLSPGPGTHADTLSATLDALFTAKAREVLVAGGDSGLFDRLGHRRETFGRPVRFVDLHQVETEWNVLGTKDQGSNVRVVSTIANVPYLVSLAVASRGRTVGNAFTLENLLTSLRGRAGDFEGTRGAFMTELMHSVSLRLCVVDAFDTRRTVIVGTDALAVDAVSAAVMGFDPAGIAVLRESEEAGLGVADLARIRVLGDPLSAPDRSRLRTRRDGQPTPRLGTAGRRDRVA